MATTRTGLGYEVAVGLLAGPAEFQRIRETRHTGMMARLWRRFEKDLDDAMARHYSVHPLADLALGAVVTGRLDWAQAAINKALEIAHEPHWLHWEAGCTPLTGMHNTHSLAIVVDWLWPLLGRDQREALLGAVIAKGVENLAHAPAGVRDELDGRGQLVMARRMDKDDPHCLHKTLEAVNNWDLWFASGIYMVAALAERAWLKPEADWPKLDWGHYYQVGYDMDAARIARWKGIALERITTALAAQLGPDGDYAEGISYADYSGRAMITALTVLERVDGLNHWPQGMFALPYWMRNQYIADIPFGVANYNDARMQTGLALQLLAHIAARSRDPQVQGYLHEVIDLSDNFDSLLLVGYAPDVPAAPMTRPAAMRYTHTGQVNWRTGEDRNGVFFAVKAGAHGGAHQHRDRTSIFLSAYSEHLIVDTGDSRYATPPSDPSFDATRAHNCLLIDGREQFGSNDRPVSGHILEHVHNEAVSTALADASECYEGIESCRRRVVFLRPDIFVVADRVVGECSTLTWLLQGNNQDGKAAWEMGDRCAVLSRPGAKLYIYLAEPTTRLHVALGTMDNVQQAIMRLETDIPGHAVTAVLIPVRAGEAAPECRRADDGALTIRYRGKQHTIQPGDDAVTVDGTAYSFGG